MPTLRGQVQADIQLEDYIISGDWNFDGQNNFTDLNIFSKHSALTNSVQILERFQHTTSGTPANGIGMGMEFQQETSVGNDEIIGNFGYKVTDVTPAAEDAEFFISLMNGGAAATEVFNIKPTQLEMQGNLVSTVTGTDGSLILKNASSVITVNLDTNGLNYINGGNLGVGTTTADKLFHMEEDTALTNTVNIIERSTHTTSGTPAAGIGVGHEFEQETSASNNEIIGNYAFVMTDVTAAAEDADFVLSLMEAGAAAAEKFRVTSKGDTYVQDSLEIGNIGNPGDGTSIFSIKSGTHGTHRADTVQLTSVDLSAGNTMLSVQVEGTSSGTGTGDNTSDGWIAIKYAGTTHYILTKSTQPI